MRRHFSEDSDFQSLSLGLSLNFELLHFEILMIEDFKSKLLEDFRKFKFLGLFSSLMLI